MRRIFFCRSAFIVKMCFFRYCTGFFLEKHSTEIAAAEKVLDINEGQATPATPACSAKTPIQLPMILIIFAITDMYIVVLVFPKLR